MHHDHDHAHNHEGGHEHPHTHEHAHEHSHTHEHAHPHTHDHAHSSADGQRAQPKEIDRVLALMNYMLEHNRQHTEELAQMAGKLEGLGQTGSASLLQESVRFFFDGNEKLEESLQNIKGE